MVDQSLQLEIVSAENLDLVEFIYCWQFVYVGYCFTDEVVVFLGRHLWPELFLLLSVICIWVVVELNFILVFGVIYRIARYSL